VRLFSQRSSTNLDHASSWLCKSSSKSGFSLDGLQHMMQRSWHQCFEGFLQHLLEDLRIARVGGPFRRSRSSSSECQRTRALPVGAPQSFQPAHTRRWFSGVHFHTPPNLYPTKYTKRKCLPLDDVRASRRFKMLNPQRPSVVFSASMKSQMMSSDIVTSFSATATSRTDFCRATALFLGAAGIHASLMNEPCSRFVFSHTTAASDRR